MEESDEALMARYAGDEEAVLETLIRRHGSALLGYLMRMTGQREQAEDLFQETFLRVHRKAHTFKGSGGFKSWLYAIATRAALDLFRRQGRRPRLLSPEGETEAQTPAIERIPDSRSLPSEQAEQSDRAEQVRGAVMTLPPRQRTALNLAFFEDLTYPQVAAIMGCSVGTIKTQMSRALRALARLLPRPDAEPITGGSS